MARQTLIPGWAALPPSSRHLSMALVSPGARTAQLSRRWASALTCHVISLGACVCRGPQIGCLRSYLNFWRKDNFNFNLSSFLFSSCTLGKQTLIYLSLFLTLTVHIGGVQCDVATHALSVLIESNLPLPVLSTHPPPQPEDSLARSPTYAHRTFPSSWLLSSQEPGQTSCRE